MNHVLPNTDLEYLIRFQNTGNAPAANVLVSDTIAEHLDLNSVEVNGFSHPVSTSIDFESRTIDFYFSAINLPDSTSNEPESHGFIRFKIEQNDDLVHETEINNTGYIYFDYNEAIITNTTWTTIFDCDYYQPSFVMNGNQLIAEEGGDYQWYLEGNVILNANSQTYLAASNGYYSVQVTHVLGCEAMSSQQYVNVVGIEEVILEKVQIAPNPMNDVTTLIFYKRGDYIVSIFDVQGRLAHDYQIFGEENLIIRKNNLLSGEYHIVVMDVDSKTKWLKKLVIE